MGPGDLTRRDREILALFCRGLSYAFYTSGLPLLY